jgi:hypothetical protein
VANVLDDLATRVATAISGTVGTNIFKSTMPPTPDACVSIIETGGLAPTRAFGTAGIQYERPGIQFLIRGAPNDYETPRTTAQTMFENLATIETEDLSGTRYYLSENLQEPFPLDVDEQERPTIAFNMVFTKDVNA